MCLLKILKESLEEVVIDFNKTAFQPAYQIHIFSWRKWSAFPHQIQPCSDKHPPTLSQKSQSETTAFSKPKPPQKSFNHQGTPLTIKGLQGEGNSGTTYSSCQKWWRHRSRKAAPRFRSAQGRMAALPALAGQWLGARPYPGKYVVHFQKRIGKCLFLPRRAHYCSLWRSEGPHSLTRNNSGVGHNSESLAWVPEKTVMGSTGIAPMKHNWY